MALIAMASYVNHKNDRLWQLKKSIDSLNKTVDWRKHRFFIVDNNSTEETQQYYEELKNKIDYTLIKLPENIGTAKAINKAWVYRRKNENAVKIDSDIVIEEDCWLDRLEECIDRDPKLGIIGLKRTDLIENPWRADNDWYKSTLKMLSHQAGQRWIILEEVNHVLGSCQLYSSKLLDKIGYLYQNGYLYGFDDALASIRCRVAGFYSAFYSHILIHHIDPGTTDYQKWKEDYAKTKFDAYHALIKQYLDGSKSVYHGPNDD